MEGAAGRTSHSWIWGLIGPFLQMAHQRGPWATPSTHLPLPWPSSSLAFDTGYLAVPGGGTQEPACPADQGLGFVPALHPPPLRFLLCQVGVTSRGPLGVLSNL